MDANYTRRSDGSSWLPSLLLLLLLQMVVFVDLAALLEVGLELLQRAAYRGSACQVVDAYQSKPEKERYAWQGDAGAAAASDAAAAAAAADWHSGHDDEYNTMQ